MDKQHLKSPIVIAELEKAFKVAEASDDFDVHLHFKEMLLASSEPDVVALHFALLQRTKNDRLFEVLTRFYKWRGKPGEAYLEAVLLAEAEPFSISVALQILGVMRSRSVIEFARQFISHSDERVRERACMVLGWMGTRKDLVTLRNLGLSDPSVKVRKWAATQQMHICLRYPAAKNTVVAYLYEVIQKESDTEVVEMIIYTAQEVLRRRFGLKAGESVSDLVEAKRKATVALHNLVNKNATYRPHH
jgi:hypothetical protein